MSHADFCTNIIFLFDAKNTEMTFLGFVQKLLIQNEIIAEKVVEHLGVTDAQIKRDDFIKIFEVNRYLFYEEHEAYPTG